MNHLVSEIEEVVATVDAPWSPGQVLRAGREQLGLSPEAVADKLHLSTDQIRSLERDDYRQFAAPIFVTGYLRCYARLLDIPAAPLLAALQPQEMETPALQPELSVAPPLWRQHNKAAWVGLLAGGGLLILVLIWLLPGEDMPSSVVTTASTPQTAPVEAAVSSTAVPGAPEQPLAALPDTHSRVQATAPLIAKKVQPGPPPDRLRLQFRDDSWVEISDADGRRLFFNLGKRGDIRELQGRAPFTILLGNAPAVGIEYNGKAYKHQRYNHKNVARFKLGGP